MKKNNGLTDDELRSEYDFDYSRAVHGKYSQRLRKEGSNIIILEPDIAESFRDSKAVNKALRSLLEITQTTRLLTRPAVRRIKKS